MNFKKLFVGALASAALLVSGSFTNNAVVHADEATANTTTTAQPQLSKDEIIKKIEDVNSKNIQSLRLRENITVSYKAKKKNNKITVKLELIEKEKPTVAKITYSIAKQKETVYVTDKYVYSKNGKRWVKEKVTNSTTKKLSKKDKKQLNKLRKNIEQRFQKYMSAKNIVENLNNFTQNNVTVTSSNGNYLVSLNNSSEFNNLLKQTMLAFVQTVASKKDTNKIEKSLNVNNFNFVETVDQNTYKLKNLTLNLQVSFNKEFNISVDVTADQFNQHNNLKVPAKVVKHAKSAK
ncbi:hypothetical protein [Lactobacillus kalixensis]|uniref:Uncharacterized protein n=1 Tax=Lactobacillus kalixensis DSM 16043 TaxID=1423763 RepID=A0A0R1U7Q6_9LACO|nr:hypothetical protein [Lactobacillus kalixensis]KRL89280.1 hypothetical protein FC46_GL000897 [Lactobacillus kalixensis DSM 16043]